MTQKPPAMPEFDVPISATESGRLTTVWWEWLQGFVRWNEGGGGGVTQADADTRYVNVAGDTMSGDLILDKPNATTSRVIKFTTAGADTWAINSHNDGRLYFTRGVIDNPLMIDGTTGSVFTAGNVLGGKGIVANGGVGLQNYSAVTGGQPAVGLWHGGRGTCYGMWNAVDNTLGLGSLDGANVPNATYLSMSGTLANFGTLVLEAKAYNLNALLNGFSVYANAANNNFHYQFQTGRALIYSTLDGSIYLQNAGINSCRWQNDGNFVCMTSAWKPGGGVWADSSDVRIKNIVGEYSRGLDEVIGLRPVLYTFKGNDTLIDPSADRLTEPPYAGSPHFQAATNGTQYVGLIAQEVEQVFPEMVTPGSGWIDGVEVADLRSLDTTPLIYALIGAIKTLDARLKELEGNG